MREAAVIAVNWKKPTQADRNVDLHESFVKARCRHVLIGYDNLRSDENIVVSLSED